jgi:hypothetical protein
MTTTATKVRPILFSAPMVHAILAGRKTQTRRIAKPPAKAVFLPDDHWKTDPDEPGTAYFDDGSGRLLIKCPHGKPGDRLWLKETWADAMSDAGPCICYKANLDRKYCEVDAWPINYDLYPGCKFANWASDLESGTEGWWRSSRFMPRWASRITLEITDVRVERLTKISSEDARAEGFEDYPAFLDAFYKLNAKRITYADDPWVWALTFRRIEATP